jgi:hypothetical protein
LLATLAVDEQKATVEVAVDTVFREAFIEREMKESYRYKEDEDSRPLEYASDGEHTVLHQVSIGEEAEREFRLYLKERKDSIEAWARRQMRYHGCEFLPLDIHSEDWNL